MTTLSGVLFDTKAGPMLDGVIIHTEQDLSKYFGKNVEISGTLIESPWSPTNDEGLPQQGFEGKVLTNIITVRVVDPE